MISVISFDVQVIQDNDDSERQEVFYITVFPVRTAIVLTERVAVTICNGGILMMFTISKISVCFQMERKKTQRLNVHAFLSHSRYVSRAV